MNGFGAIKGTVKQKSGRTPIIGARITTNTGKQVWSNKTDGSYCFPHPIDLKNPVIVTCEHAPFQSQAQSVWVDSITTKKVPFLLS